MASHLVTLTPSQLPLLASGLLQLFVQNAYHDCRLSHGSLLKFDLICCLWQGTKLCRLGTVDFRMVDQMVNGKLQMVKGN